MDKVFDALASDVRRKILLLLSAGSMNAGEISDKFSISKPSLSKHLGILENADLVKREKKGQFVRYELEKKNLLDTLDDFTAKLNSTKKAAKTGSVKQENSTPVKIESSKAINKVVKAKSQKLQKPKKTKEQKKLPQIEQQTLF